MLYFFSNNCALVGENVSCYYLSRRIAIVLLPVAAQSDGQSSAIASHHGLSLAAAAAAGTGLSLSTRQATTQFGLSSSTAAALSTNRHNWSSSSINRIQCSARSWLVSAGHRKHVQLLLTQKSSLLLKHDIMSMLSISNHFFFISDKDM